MGSPTHYSPYVARHIGPTADDRSELLQRLGFDSFEALIEAAVPKDIHSEALDLPEPLSEDEALARLRGYADQNIALKPFYGQGFYETSTPPVIRRNVLESPAWYTAYTPYQPEISQGRLEALLHFQNMVSELTCLPVAGASLLDEASAAAEAVALMARVSRKGRRIIFDQRLHPQVLAVATERARTLALEVEITDITEGLVGEDLVGVILAYPGTEGDLSDIRRAIEDIHSRGALAAVACDLLALQLLEAPGTLGADIAFGSSQRFGVPLFFGGPHAAFMAVTSKLTRQLPGRVVGIARDADGNPALRLALQTREQHIRREKATSNICTAQALLAVTATMYAIWHGADGLRQIAQRVHARACDFAASVQDSFELAHQHFFDTVTVLAPGKAEAIVQGAEERGYLLRAIGADKVSVSFGESASQADVEALAEVFGVQTREAEGSAIPQSLERSNPTLKHPVFSSIHSETQMLRYLRKLSDRDLALDRSMIPLGSCTMKLNPTAGLEPISWPNFANIHPYAPDRHTAGWRALIEELQGWLERITGYAKVSVQPNAGSQGELAGLLAIRRYHVARGEGQRDVVLIPRSAHGTNAASAKLANLDVVVVENDGREGSIDMADLEAKIDKVGDRLAGIMITYPSTHGVFEASVREVCAKIHEHGGQVYIDGANMNALTGIAQPGEFGGDVSHLNLHKTFTIPHGGGGPGVGPVCVAEHLAPYLPSDPLGTDPTQPAPGDAGVPIASARYGSAGALPISWAYIAMMGAKGLRQATATAILNANYIAAELKEDFPVLYTGPGGLVAHECILDLRPLSDATGVSAADVAKRLIDFGFHAPTLSFPVAGTLMVEPTESEDVAELDRFIQAMRAIRAEIAEIEQGTTAYEESMLHHAPFNAQVACADQWPYAFGREEAVYPVESLREAKYFPPVRRLDEAYGDRNFCCTG